MKPNRLIPLVLLSIFPAFALLSPPAESSRHPARVLVNDIKINDDTGTASQQAPAVAMHPYGPAVVCWIDDRMGTRDVFFQMFGRRGQRFGTLGNVRVNDGPDDNEVLVLSLAMYDAGNTVAVWTDFRRDPFGDIFAQFYDPSGRKAGPNVIAHTVKDSSQVFPSVAMNGSGHGVAVWEDTRSGVMELYARRFGPGMVPKEPEFLVGSQHLYWNFAGAVNHDAVVQPDGSFSLCWIEGSFPGKMICRA